jgi:crotonobetainyl-CoA:carnitine CoA-transferase CaiB-like acyl-CoA transferase
LTPVPRAGEEGPVSTAPLDGTRVLSVGHTLPGLYCIAVLRDLGADVTRIERPARTADPRRFEGVASAFPTRSLDAGTARCEIDLSVPAGAGTFRRMSAAADVVLEGFRPGTAERLGIGHPTLAAANPRLVYVAVSGYGQEGPWRDRAGHDVNYLAATGALDLAGDPGGPPALPGLTYADGLAGMSAALNVLAALQARARDGRGQLVDVAIVDGPLFLLSMEIEHHWRTGGSRTRGDTHLTGRFPWYGVFETADGRHLAVGAVERAFHERLCRLVGHPELAGRQAVSDEERDEQLRVFRAAFRRRTLDEWAALLGEADACVTPVLGVGEAADAAHTARAVREVPGEPARLVRSPVRLAAAPLAARRETRATLEAYGFAASEIDALRDAGVVGTE